MLLLKVVLSEPKQNSCWVIPGILVRGQHMPCFSFRFRGKPWQVACKPRSSFINHSRWRPLSSFERGQRHRINFSVFLLVRTLSWRVGVLMSNGRYVHFSILYINWRFILSSGMSVNSMCSNQYIHAVFSQHVGLTWSLILAIIGIWENFYKRWQTLAEESNSIC